MATWNQDLKDALLPNLHGTATKQVNHSKSSRSLDEVVAVVTSIVTAKVGIFSKTAHGALGNVQVADVALGGFKHVHSTEQDSPEQEGVLGASFFLFHLCKTHASDWVEVKDFIGVQTADDPQFLSFLRRIKLKEFRKLITGYPRNRLRTLTGGIRYGES
eukprot:scaffold1667_cov173-Amphora_coffeaeformis.AAC.32